MGRTCSTHNGNEKCTSIRFCLILSKEDIISGAYVQKMKFIYTEDVNWVTIAQHMVSRLAFFTTAANLLASY